MQKVRVLGQKFVGIEFKKMILAGIFVLVGLVSAMAEEPSNNVDDVRKELQNLEQKLEMAILEIDKKENQLIKSRIETCETIEKKLKDAKEKKVRLSKKKRKNLQSKLEMEYRTIDMIKQLNMLTREAKKKEYENELEKVFAKHDVYLSVQ